MDNELKKTGNKIMGYVSNCVFIESLDNVYFIAAPISKDAIDYEWQITGYFKLNDKLSTKVTESVKYEGLQKIKDNYINHRKTI